MKKAFSILICVLVVILSCSKDEITDTQNLTDDLLLKAANGQVFEVNPGGDETAAILEAFESAKAAGKGAIVKLNPGTYEIGAIEIREFFGTFLGSGVENTVVTNTQDFDPAKALELNKKPALIRFVGGEVTVKDMTLTMTVIPVFDSTPISILIFTDYTSDFMPAKKNIKVWLDKLTVAGAPGPFWALRNLPFVGVHIGPDFAEANDTKLKSTVQADISNCYFSNFAYNVNVFGCKHSKIDIGTEGANTFDGSWMSVVTGENVGMHAQICNNVFNNWGADAIDIGSGSWTPMEYVEGELGTYMIRNNTINMADQHYGLGVFDVDWCTNPDDPRYMKFIVENNIFNGGTFYTAAMALFTVRNGLFANNIITSEGPTVGIDLFGTSWFGVLPEDPLWPLTLLEDCRFINNKFNCPVSIYLDIDTKDNLFVGDLSKAEIADFGVDNRFNEKPAPPALKKADKPNLGGLEERINKLKEIVGK